MTLRPIVTLKLAASLDGRIATLTGESRWITGAQSRAVVHAMRAAHDAVGVGAGTARADDPSLLAVLDPPCEAQPMRVVFDRGLSLAPESQLAMTCSAHPVVVLGDGVVAPARANALRALGVKIVQVDKAASADAMLRALRAETGVSSILIEGGSIVAAALIGEGCVDRLEWFTAPVVLGGDAAPAVSALGLARLAAAPAFVRTASAILGADRHDTYVLKTAAAV